MADEPEAEFVWTNKILSPSKKKKMYLPAIVIEIVKFASLFIVNSLGLLLCLKSTSNFSYLSSPAFRLLGDLILVSVQAIESESD